MFLQLFLRWSQVRTRFGALQCHAQDTAQAPSSVPDITRMTFVIVLDHSIFSS